MSLLLHSNDTAGTLGAVFIVFGLVGAGCVGECTALLTDISVLYLYAYVTRTLGFGFFPCVRPTAVF
jgi:hypothetical protein